MNELITPASSRIQCSFGAQSAFTYSLLAAFGAAFGVEFLSGTGQGSLPSIPIILIGEEADGILKNCSPTRAFLAPAKDSIRGEEIDRIEICGEIPGKPWLRQQSLKLSKAMRVEPLQLRLGAEVLGRSKAGPVWVREIVGRAVVDRVALPLPEFVATPDSSVFEWLNSDTIPQLLPLIQFVREVTGEHRWHSNLKASFMFDDPNLHAGSYGFIDYREMATQASRHRYHVSLATVPLDGWFVSAKAATLFRVCRAQLSLLVHGNDHVQHELARNFVSDQREALLRQALRRIRRIEMKAGVEVCRVMAAPHGACKEEMLRDMARFGFEAACISHGSLRYHNRERAWTKSLGSRPAVIIEGLPVFPRFPLTADNFLQKVLLAAYLDQPIIPMGHHEDISSGLDILNGLADQINHLDPVQWVCMSEIARTHFLWRREAETFVVRPYSRLVRISVPEGATRLRVEPPVSSNSCPVRYSLVRANRVSCDFELTDGVEVVPGETVWLKPFAGGCLNPDGGTMPRFKFWPLARRVAGEARDRIKPWMKRG